MTSCNDHTVTMTTISPATTVAIAIVVVTLTPHLLVAETPSAMTLLTNLTTLSLNLADNVTPSLLAAAGNISVSLPCVIDAATNTTTCGLNATTAAPPDVLPHSVWVTVFLGLLAGVVSLVTILGNITVLLAFGLERTIRQPTNYFLASLAVSDLLIGTFSMPLYTQYLLIGEWPLGPWLCDLWLSLDWTVCLTSQYTVFLITMDRFLSVKIPARYRNWRTEHKVLIMISITWILPALVFFTSIIGWQYFVGKRTVEDEECEVQFMNDAMFTFILTIGYFWITCFVIGILYGGIYKVALDLQRKSDAKHKKLQTTMELAAEGPNSQSLPGGNICDGRSDGGASGGGSNNNSSGTDSIKASHRSGKNVPNNRKSVRAALPCPVGAQVNTTSFTTKGADKDEDRSSSPAFASDDDNSSSGGAVIASKPPPPAPLSSGVYIGRPNPTAVFVNSALFANTGGLVRSLHGDLFFGPVDTQESQNLLQSPPPYSQVVADGTKTPYAANGGTGSDAEANAAHTHDGEDGMYSSAINRNEKQMTPLMNDEINKGCRFIDEQSFMETMSSENSALLPVISRLASEVEDSDDPSGENLASSPIWKRRNSLPSLNNDDYDIDDDFTTGDFTTNTTTLNSSVFNGKNIDDDEDDSEDDEDEGDESSSALRHARGVEGGAQSGGSGDNRKKMRENNSVSSGAQTLTNHQISPSGAPSLASNTNNAYGNQNVPMSDTNEDSSRSDIHCLSAATRRRCNKDTRLNTLVKSVRSRNSRKRNRRERKSKSENRARKALRTISIILGAFVLCWMPYHIAIMVMALCKNCVPGPVYNFTYWMCYLNSPINPFCYAFANAQFKRTFIRIMRFDWHRT